MKFDYNNREISEEELIAIFPRRINRSGKFEIWLYPYIDKDYLYDEEDFVVLEFGADKDIIHVISTDKKRLENRFHLDRISSLLHDISLNFDFKLYYLDNFDERLDNLLTEIIKD